MNTSIEWVAGPEYDLPLGFDGALFPYSKQLWRRKKQDAYFYRGAKKEKHYTSFEEVTSIPFADLPERTQKYILMKS